jgi:hypothetical protein
LSRDRFLWDYRFLKLQIFLKKYIAINKKSKEIAVR